MKHSITNYAGTCPTCGIELQVVIKRTTGIDDELKKEPHATVNVMHKCGGFGEAILRMRKRTIKYNKELNEH